MGFSACQVFDIGLTVRVMGGRMFIPSTMVPESQDLLYSLCA
jgi:hypothetical protein